MGVEGPGLRVAKAANGDFSLDSPTACGRNVLLMGPESLIEEYSFKA